MTFTESDFEEGYEELVRRSEYDYEDAMFLDQLYDRRKAKKYGGFGVWLDNCGDDVWYCNHCYQQNECGKRLR